MCNLDVFTFVHRSIDEIDRLNRCSRYFISKILTFLMQWNKEDDNHFILHRHVQHSALATKILLMEQPRLKLAQN